MADAFNKTSFIPQKSLSTVSKKKSTSGLFFFISVIIFILSVLGSIGIIAYKKVVEQGIENKAGSLERAKEAFDPNLIESLSRLDNRIESSKELLNSHIAISPIFSLLEDLTLKNVEFDQFEFRAEDSGLMTLLMSGQAKDYATVVLQSDTFGQSKSLRDQIFSDVNLNKFGNVGFSFRAVVDPSLVSYKNNVEGF